MRSSILSAVLCLFLSVIFFSCKKNADHPTKPIDTDTIVHINYIYLATSFQIQSDSLKQIELILSEPGGKILLDTVAAVNTNIVADITKTTARVDLTVIRYRPIAKAFYVSTEKSIDASAWSILPGSDSLTGVPPNVIPPYFASSVYYTNGPAGPPEPYYWSGSNANYQEGSYNNTGNNILSLGFLQEPGFEVYLVLPNRGLYNFHPMSAGGNDVVDLSKMDTALRVQIAHPTQYSTIEFTLNGFPDTNNVQRNVAMMHYLPGIDTLAGSKVIYPGRKVFTKYQFGFSATDNANKTTISFNDPWCDSVNANPFLPDETYFTLSSTQNNNFSVQFTKLHPSYYTMDWGTSQFYWRLDVPADSTVLNPLRLLTDLNSKLLKGLNGNGMKISDLTFGYLIDNGMPVLSPLVPLDGKFHGTSQQKASAYLEKFF
jgi:hypothetical protein